MFFEVTSGSFKVEAGLSKHEKAMVDVMLGAPVQWPKKPESWKEIAGDAEVVYEDDDVIAFHERQDDPAESARVAGEIRVMLLSKTHVPSLLHLGPADHHISAALLHGIQQVAYRLDLNVKGFEVRMKVLPPLQHRPQLAFEIRSGKPPVKSSQADG